MRTNVCLTTSFNFICTIFLMLSPGSCLFAQTPDTVIFRDDFDRSSLGNFWQADNSWSIVSGSAYNFVPGSGGSLRTTESYPQTSYIIETRAKGFTDSHGRQFRITFGQADPEGQEMYILSYTDNDAGRLTLSRSTDNLYYPQDLDEAAIFPTFNSSQWYTFKIAKYTSGLIQVYLNQGSGYSSIPLLEAIDSTYPFLGHAGWQVDTETSPESFYVDWISASKPTVEKPAVREKIEDSLITQVSVHNGKAYQVSKLVPGVKLFIDRDYTATSVPDYLNGASFIQTANDDKAFAIDSFLTFFAKTSAIVYIGYDPRGEVIPAWLSQWTKTGDQIQVSDDKTRYFDVYSKLVAEVYPFPIILGGNLAAPAKGSKTNYIVIAVKQPDMQALQAEDAFLSGAVVSNDHLNYHGTGFANFQDLSTDYVEWTVQTDVPGFYNLGFRFSNGDPKDRTLQITDNGTSLGTVDFSGTFSWDSWAFLNGPNAFLSAGIHKIRLTAIGDGGPNIDELSMFFLSTATPPALARNYLPSTSLPDKLSDLAYKVYPNPFVQSTKIFYELKEKASVTLSVYTLQGQRIQVIENSVQEAGNYEANFNADKLAKGIYVIRLQIGNELSSRKLIKSKAGHGETPVNTIA